MQQGSDWWIRGAEEVIERAQARVAFWEQRPADATSQDAIERERAFIAKVQADIAEIEAAK